MRYYKAQAVDGGLDRDGNLIVRYFNIIRCDNVVVSTAASEKEAWRIADLLNATAQEMGGISLFQLAA